MPKELKRKILKRETETHKTDYTTEETVSQEDICSNLSSLASAFSSLCEIDEK